MEIFVNDEIRNERANLCQACDKLTMLQTCSICNCFMPAKTKLPGASCPEGKWKAVESVKINNYAN